MRETWYVLEDGGVADPNEVAPDEDGALRHKSGARVAMRGQVPSSRGVDPDEERAKAKARDSEPENTEEPKAGEQASSDARDPKAGKVKPGYTTRESKAG